MNNDRHPATNDPIGTATNSDLRAELLTFAQQTLPTPMIPSRIVVLSELPKLPNGKVDRNNLRARPDLASIDTVEFVPPTTDDELRVAEIWRSVLGVDAVGLTDSVFDLGGDSLAIAKIVACVRDSYGRSPTLRDLYDRPSLGEFVTTLTRDGRDSFSTGNPRSVSPEAMEADAVLPDDVRAHNPYVTPTNGHAHILLTGATGYTGAYLAYELLQRSQARLSALVRAPTPEAATARVRTNLEQFGLWNPRWQDRIEGIPGDLARPYLGLDRRTYTRLAEQTEMIVHNGALSNYALPYTQLKAANVLGTLEVLRLAANTRTKPVHFISSLAVFPGEAGSPRFNETKLEVARGVLGGYRQSKWVAERLVSEAHTRGIPTNVYRPGLIAGAQRSGACSTDTFLNAITKGCIQIRSALDFDVTLEVAPVDFCAEVVAHVALSDHTCGQYFHIPGTQTLRWTQYVEHLRRYGYTLEDTAYPDWVSKLREALGDGQDNELARFLPLFGDDQPAPDLGYAGSTPIFDTTNLEAAIAGTDIERLDVDGVLIGRYLDHFIATGFLPAPKATQ